MTYHYKCAVCGHVFEQSFRNVKFDDRPEAVAPLRVSDRDSVMQCPNCEGDSHYDEAATIQASASFTLKDDPLEIWIRKGYKPIDLNHGGSEARPDRRKTTQGVHRVIEGLPGRVGGHRLPGSDSQ